MHVSGDVEKTLANNLVFSHSIKMCFLLRTYSQYIPRLE